MQELETGRRWDFVNKLDHYEEQNAVGKKWLIKMLRQEKKQAKREI